MNTLPQAHSATHPGLRGHSIGSDYPWTVRGIGNGTKVEYQAWNCHTGKASDKYPSAARAYEWLDARQTEWHALAKVSP